MSQVAIPYRTDQQSIELGLLIHSKKWLIGKVALVALTIGYATSSMTLSDSSQSLVFSIQAFNPLHEVDLGDNCWFLLTVSPTVLSNVIWLIWLLLACAALILDVINRSQIMDIPGSGYWVWVKSQTPWLTVKETGWLSKCWMYRLSVLIS